jgi:hypothetical protein
LSENPAVEPLSGFRVEKIAMIFGFGLFFCAFRSCLGDNRGVSGRTAAGVQRVLAGRSGFEAAGVSLMKQRMSERGGCGDLQPGSGSVLTRRHLIRSLGAGAGSIGLATALSDSGESGVQHFAPRARRVIHLFMNGGPYQGDFLRRISGPSVKRRACCLRHFVFVRVAAVVFRSAVCCH